MWRTPSFLLLRRTALAGLGAVALAVAPAGRAAAAGAPPRILGLSHVAVKATDFDASVAFYRDFLGFAEQGRLSDRNNGRRQLVFLKISDTQTIEVFDAANVTQVAGNLYQIALEVADAEEMRRHLQNHGFKVPPKVPLGQMRNANFMVRDPNGYIIELVQYLPEGRMVLDRGKFLSATRVADRLVAAGVTTAKRADTQRFYGDILGFPPEQPRAGPGGNEQRQRLRVGASRDYVEVLVTPKDETPFFRLEVRDLVAAQALLQRSPYFPRYRRSVAIAPGPDQRRSIMLHDPEGIRVELVEPESAGANSLVSPHAPPVSKP